MAEERTSRSVRDLLNDIDHHGGRVPVAGLIDLAERAEADLTIDRSGDPPLVYLRPRRDPAFRLLSPRELEVAELLATGATNREIAAALFISAPTVKDHVHAVLTKTGLATRAAVAAAWTGARGG